MVAKQQTARASAWGLVLGVALVFGVAGCSEPTGPERPIDGPRLYNQHCARCHGVDGKGLPEVPGVRNLTDKNLMEMLSDERIKSTIRMGRPPTMPAFSHFHEPTLKVLTAYVRQFSEPTPPPSAP